jgi:hypothetical protein
MAYIDIGNNMPGIVGLLQYRPETAKPLGELAEVLLRGPSTLTSAEREMIASYVSHQNEFHFCHTSHGAAAAHHLDGDLNLIDDIKKEFEKNLKAMMSYIGWKFDKISTILFTKKGITPQI